MPYKDPEAARANNLRNTRAYRARKTAAKIARFEAELAARPRWPETDLAWAAGMFEGEGTVTIVRSGPRYTRGTVSLTSTERDIVEFFQQRWPGSVSEKTPTNPRHNISWTWRVQNNGIIGFLEDVGPYLRTQLERDKFGIVLASQRKRWAGYKAADHMAEMAEFHRQIAALNARGRPATQDDPASS